MDTVDRRVPRTPDAKSCKKMAELRAMGKLSAGTTERARLVLDLRFGMTGEPPYTLEKIGEVLHVTRERARQIQSKALLALGVDPWA
jgi:DNA-directed RNA polymerase sigma subunit (sigma70/sigma32)